MNKPRKRLLKRVGKDKYKNSPLRCEYCGAELDKNYWYHKQFGTCNAECYMYMVGMNYSDFF